MVRILLHPNLDVDTLEAVVRTFQFKVILLLGSVSVCKVCNSRRMIAFNVLLPVCKSLSGTISVFVVSP